MPSRSVILPLLAALSMVTAANGASAGDKPIMRCAQMRFDQSAPENIGYTLKRIKLKDPDISDAPVIVQPAMAGLRGPRLTFLGRDVRLATIKHQTSPQELWHRANWNQEQVDTACQTWPKRTWIKSLRYGLYWKGILDTTLSYSTERPHLMHRSRALGEAMLVRPYGFTFGGALSIPLGTTTDRLFYLNDPRPPVRRDIAKFSNRLGVERLYASWRTTPFTDFYASVSAGWIEEMYAGAGVEMVYRPFESPFWIGADAWRTWRRDPDSNFNLHITDRDGFTGHVRAGYDVPGSTATFSVAAGRYLAGDTGVSLHYSQEFLESLRLDAGITWTNRREDAGFFRDTNFEPMVRITWAPDGSKHRELRATFRQLGRDGGQMIDRPQPLEKLTSKFSARTVAQEWTRMFD